MPNSITDQVLWTLCPQGLSDDGKSCRISVFVAPRLTPNAPNLTLKASDVWLRWPEALAQSKFAVEVLAPSGPSVVHEITGANLTLTSQTNISVYHALFNEQTPVNGYVFKDLRNKLILSYPVGKLNSMMEGIYAALGILPGDTLPSRTRVASAGVPTAREPGPLSFTSEKGRTNRTDILNHIRQAPNLDALTSNSQDLLDLFSFCHKPLLAETELETKRKDPREDAKYPGYVQPKLPSAQDLTAQTDFHRIAAAIGNYAELARYCGFVLDFTFPAALLTDGTVRLAMRVNRPGGTDTFPVTVCNFAKTKTFEAQAATSGQFIDRCLALSSDGYSLVQMDVDGAAFKTIGLGASLPRMKVNTFNGDDFHADPGDPQVGAPSLRTGGFMLAQNNRYLAVQKRATRAGQLNDKVAANQQPDDLKAEDLTRGYRIDIRDVTRDPAHWQSLCRRGVEYSFLTPNMKPEAITALGWIQKSDGTVSGHSQQEEEGTISLAAGSSPDGSVPNVYTIHEGMFTWRGWSLCAPEPANALRTTPLATPAGASQAEKDAAMVGPNTATTPDGLPLNTDFFVPKGSLPALRFGHVYQARLRAVDLTGMSAAFTATSAQNTWTPPAAYLRYEPLEAPAVTLVGKVVPDKQGVTDYSLIDRTNIPLQGESMGRAALRTYDDATRNRKTVSRNIAAARVTQRFAETHSVLDDPSGRLRRDTFALLATQDNAFIPTELPAADWLNPHTSTSFTGKTTQYAVSERGFALPYLPDPYAVAVMARMMSLGAKQWVDVMIPLYPAGTTPASPGWPHPAPIEIVGQEDFPEFKADGSPEKGYILRVPMPKACRQTIRLSSVLNEKALDTMALWELFTRKKDSYDELKRQILHGWHWMFTPWREIEFLHATQRPLIKPDSSHLISLRTLSEVDAKLSFGTPLSGPSTARLDIDATWSEPEDNPAEADAKSAPVTRAHSAHVAQLPIARLEGLFGDVQRGDIPHTFPDTRYRRVTYDLNALTRFKEFFDAGIRNDETQQNVMSDPVRLWINNSAPPPAPGIVYAIPTFGWFRGKNGVTTSSKRTGGIRVYLERPWMVSGYNEMLAVILPNTNDPETSNDTAPNRPLVTQWGRDPIRQAADITINSPKPSDFRLAKWQAPLAAPGTTMPPVEGTDLPPGPFRHDNLYVPGLSPAVPTPSQPTPPPPPPGQPTQFAIAPHEVGFDPDRQLWYADIVVSLPKGTYFPFLRLAVARYQPNSVNLAHLSTAVTCDFMQLSPDRIAVVVPLDTIGLQYNVLIYGDVPMPVYNVETERRQVLARAGKVRVQAQVLDAGADTVLGWRDLAGTIPTGPGIDYTQQGLAAKAAAIEAALKQSAQQAGQVAGQLAAGDVSAAPPPPPPAPPGPATGYKKVVLQNNKAILTQAQAATAATKNLPLFLVPPNLISQQVIIMPAAPAGGQRRILITETEAFSHNPIPGDADVERIVYAEAIQV